MGTRLSDSAEYMREYRKRNPQVLENQYRRTRVRTRALNALADLFPRVFEDLLAQEFEKEREQS